MQTQKSYLKMVQIALLAAIMLVMSFVPFLGYIPTPWGIKATTIHIPVIIGAILLGPKVGAALGGLFGLTSFLVNSFVTPSPTSFVFTPLYSLGELHGNFWSLVICFLPRILIGVTAGYVYKWLARLDKTKVGACIAAGLVGSMTNTILVMGGIYVFFGEQYAQAREVAYSALLSVIGGVIGINGVVEAIVAALLATVVARPLMEVLKQRQG